MDVDAILRANPTWCWWTNWRTPTSKAASTHKRYEDVFELLDAGIDVLSTLNVQHIESLAPTIRGLTGVQVRETVPDWVIRRAAKS